MSYLRGTQSTFGGIICEHTELKKDSSSQDLLSVIEIGKTRNNGFRNKIN
jgi:hypothetical protein